MKQITPKKRNNENLYKSSEPTTISRNLNKNIV